MSFSQKLFQLRSFITYWLDAVDEHSLHSPFLFSLYTNVLKKNTVDPSVDLLTLTRQHFERDGRMLSITDFGAGSVKLKVPLRKISEEDLRIQSQVVKIRTQYMEEKGIPDTTDFTFEQGEELVNRIKQSVPGYEEMVKRDLEAFITRKHFTESDRLN